MKLGVALWKEDRERLANLRRQARERARQILQLDENDQIYVTELCCSDPDCPDAETVFVIMKPGQPAVSRKFAKRLIEISNEELAVGLKGN